MRSKWILLTRSGLFLALTILLLSLFVAGILHIRREQPDADDSVEELASLLRSPTPQVRSDAIRRLTRLGSRAGLATSSVIEHARDPDPEVRFLVPSALVSLKTDSSAVTPVLLELLRDTDERVRENAAWAMGTFGSETKSLVKDLEILAKGETKPHVRLVMLHSILLIDPTNKSAVAGLAELVRLGDPVVSSLAVAYLGNCEALAAPHVPSVLEALQHADSSVRRGAASALGQIRVGSKDVIRALEGSIKDQDRLVRVFAIQSLGELGPAARDARDAIQAAADSEDFLTRSTARRVLREIKRGLQGSE